MDRFTNWLKERHETLDSFELKGNMEEAKVRVAPDSDVSIILASETLFLDAQIKRTIGECVEDSDIQDILNNYKDALDPPNHKLNHDGLWKFQPKIQTQDRVDETFIAMLLHKYWYPRAGEEPFSMPGPGVKPRSGVWEPVLGSDCIASSTFLIARH